jgi:TonB family protein
MSKTLFISSLAAACWLAAAAPQGSIDGSGVTVSMNGATVMHRTGVAYPPAALEAGVQGMVSVEVKLDSTGEVNDAQVLSGPDELRKAALESVLQWHFTHDLAGATRTIQIAFEPPKRSDTAPVGTMRQRQFLTVTGSTVQQGRIATIRVAGLSDQASSELLASLPVHQGDEWNAETRQKANQAVTAFDEHLIIRTASMSQGSSGSAEINLVITVPGIQPPAPIAAAAIAAAKAPVAGRITVGGNVQAAMIVTKVPPVYPDLAKRARVSGEVQLSAVIAKDGTVQQLNVVGGPPLLIQAALDAVKQWVYQPTIVGGSPVEVETTIDINFTLNQ